MNHSRIDFNEMLRGSHNRLAEFSEATNICPTFPEKIIDAFQRLDQAYGEPQSFNFEQLSVTKDLLKEYSSSLNLSEKMTIAFNKSLDDFLSLAEAELAQAAKRLQKKQWKSRIAADLDNDGISKQFVQPTDISKLLATLPYYQNKLLDARKRAGNYVAPISIPRFDKLFGEATQICRRLGVSDAIREYLGEAVDPIYVSLQESTSSESWWIQPNGMQTGLEYQHFDFDFNIIKTIIYLSDVKLENGPFRYVRDSTKMNYSRSWLAFYKCFERQLQTAYGVPMGTSGSYYYRTRFLSEEFRKDALNVPPMLLGVSHFGDDIKPNTPLNAYLSEHEVPILSAEGNCLIFDGSRLIHRGGMVSAGSRLVIQIGFTSRRAFFKSNHRRLWWLLKLRLRSLIRR